MSGPSPSPSDEELMRRYREGDLAALESLFVRHARRLQAFFWGMVADPVVAEELSQKTWQRVHRERRSFPVPGQDDGERSFITWLYGLASKLRREQARISTVQASQPGAARSVTDAASLVRALRDLPDSYREAVVLHRGVGLSFPEIARVLGATEAAVAQRAGQGYAQLSGSSPDGDPDTVRQAGEAMVSPELLERAIEPLALEHNARALLPLAARDLRPAKRPPMLWLLLLAFMAAALAVLLGMRLSHAAPSVLHSPHAASDRVSL